MILNVDCDVGDSDNGVQDVDGENDGVTLEMVMMIW